ncbi:hypothetical protein FXN63_20900 [Pigmentiphaga aceris]|uniref:Uncharacterized protein n=1 Tax=Pigmentiphaga aceris TaxID=1940612 RepID=A0A5C0B2T0_9BURK|nr:hypothetical protein [Pigmentiphaga aceris]QEI08023.1 hypothetical protein FXN63_20900 [Pigmentiphaga aceris]
MRHSQIDAKMLFAFMALFAAIFLPAGVMLLATTMSPPPYHLTADPPPSWQTWQELPGGARAKVDRFSDARTAGDAVDRQLARIPTVSSSSTGNLSRYRTKSEHGLIVAVNDYVVWATAPDEARLDAAVAAIPFMAANKEGAGLYRVFDQHLAWVVAGILTYALVLILVFSRLLAWVARKPARSTQAPVTESALRERLLALDFADVTTHAEAGGELIFEYAAQGVVERLKMRLDATQHVVRAVSGGTRTGGRTASGSRLLKSWWRTMPSGPNSERLAHIVQSAGWTWQPVFTFVRVVGG